MAQKSIVTGNFKKGRETIMSRKLIVVVLFVMTVFTLMAISSWAGVIQLPRTGQTTSYAVGDDGALQKGVAWPSPRFTTNADKTITDNLTYLIWGPDGGTPTVGACAGGAKKWQGSLNYVACLNTNNYLGHNDWRLPNINEMKSLIHAGQTSSNTWLSGQGFTNVQSGFYWSSSTCADDTTLAWFIYMVDGFVRPFTKESTNYIWPVRAGQ